MQEFTYMNNEINVETIKPTNKKPSGFKTKLAKLLLPAVLAVSSIVPMFGFSACPPKPPEKCYECCDIEELPQLDDIFGFNRIDSATFSFLPDPRAEMFRIRIKSLINSADEYLDFEFEDTGWTHSMSRVRRTIDLNQYFGNGLEVRSLVQITVIALGTPGVTRDSNPSTFRFGFITPTKPPQQQAQNADLTL